MSPLTVFFAVTLIAIIIAAAVFIISLNSKREEALQKAAETESLMRRLKKKVAPLMKYQGLADIEAEGNRIRTEAQASALKERQEGQEALSGARDKARHIMDDAQSLAKDIASASAASATQIVSDAKVQAENIAGDALRTKEKAAHYKSVVRAIKNTIEGYGDEYLVANTSTLDELADEFGHKEAGAALKGARTRTRNMAKNGLAADCDYAETKRKTTAIRFVLDAFNGKVDTTLAKVKHNNFGKLRQEIIDAFSLVNGNGEAFRNARITPAYLAARQDELKWAVATNELKRQEREEQRSIREAMREEEKAKRDYEKAMKKAEKEESILQDAMVQARKQLEEASEEQRQAFEQQLLELQQKLDEAEAKNKRALSMAQQTRQGHVYVISNIGSFGEDVFKIGLTRRLEPFDRVRELGDASVPFAFDVHAMIHSEDAPALEKDLHKHFASHQLNKVNPRKEFFRVGVHDIRDAVEQMGFDIHWTMLGEAREYRESLAMVKMDGEGIEPQSSPDGVADIR